MVVGSIRFLVISSMGGDKTMRLGLGCPLHDFSISPHSGQRFGFIFMSSPVGLESAIGSRVERGVSWGKDPLTPACAYEFHACMLTQSLTGSKDGV